MKRTDHLLALASAIFKDSITNGPATAAGSPAFSRMEESYAIDEIRKPGVVSIGASDGNHEFSFRSWIKKLQQEKIKGFHFTAYQFNDKRLPAHIAAGFAGPSDLVLELTTASGISTYVLRVFHSPINDLTPEQFTVLLNSQPDPKLCWDRAATLILESNRLNERLVFDPAQTSGYLASPEGRAVFAYLAGDLIREIQVEATISGNSFIIPGSLEKQFVKYPEHPMFAGDDKEYVYLYSRRDVTVTELLQLVDAQPFGDKTWERLNRTLNEYADPELPAAPESEWRGRLSAMDPLQFQRYVSPVCRSLCTLCEDAVIKPVIPPHLAEAFGPDELEQKRAAARSKSSGQWQLQNNQQPWEYYQFQQMENVPASALPPAGGSEKLFVDTLKETRDFAASFQSAFEEAFGLAHFILTADIPDGNYDDKMIDTVAGIASQAGFSDRAVTNLRNGCWVATLFSSLGWESRRVKGLLAINLADVFGGMGSWNDEYVEHDQATYSRLSGELYERMRIYFAGLLSP